MSGDTSVDMVIARFFGAFDNRAGRSSLDSLAGLLTPDAVFFRVDDEQAQRMTADAFIAPRAALLDGGGLVAFHEYEVSARTFVFGPFALRISRYAKHGQLHGERYEGEGWKGFILVKSEGAWRIGAMGWCDATPDRPMDEATWIEVLSTEAAPPHGWCADQT